MFNYPVEKNIIRFYKYKFFGKEDLVTIESFNRKQARLMLRDFIEKNIDYHNRPIASETLSLPIYGETIKKINDIECVWVGDGWITLWEYKQRENI